MCINTNLTSTAGWIWADLKHWCTDVRQIHHSNKMCICLVTSYSGPCKSHQLCSDENFFLSHILQTVVIHTDSWFAHNLLTRATLAYFRYSKISLFYVIWEKKVAEINHLQYTIAVFNIHHTWNIWCPFASSYKLQEWVLRAVQVSDIYTYTYIYFLTVCNAKFCLFVHLLAQLPTASFWQVVGRIFNIQLHKRDFPIWAKMSLLGTGHVPLAMWRCRAGGVAWESSASGKRGWPLDAVKAAKISTLPPHLLHGRVHRQRSCSSQACCAWPGAVCVPRGAAWASTTSPARSKHGWCAGHCLHRGASASLEER